MNGSLRSRVLADGTSLVSEFLPERGVQAIEIRVAAGFSDDPADAPGCAHLVEHLALRRAVRTPSDDAVLDNLDAHGLRPVAVTTRDFTSFSVVAPPQCAVDALRGLHRMMREPDFSDHAVSAELGIIRAERMVQAADPVRRLSEVAESRIFGHPLPELQSTTTVAPMDARSFWARCHSPANIVIATSGPAGDFGSSYSGVSEYSTPVPTAGGPVSQSAFLDETLHVRWHETRKSLAHVLYAFPVRCEGVRQRAVANVLASALGGGFSSHLVKKLRVEKQLSYSPRAFYTGHGTAGMINVAATVADSHIQPVTDILSRSMRQLSDDAHIASTVEVAKLHLRTGTLIAFDDLARRASAIASAWQYGHRFDPAAVVQAIESVTPSDVRELANELAARASRHLIHPDITSSAERFPCRSA